MWLEQLGMEEYTQLFLAAEYDIATAARMTPDDLIAIGVQKPVHRKRLKFELARMIIRSPIPEHAPVSNLELNGEERVIGWMCLI